jgi:hypothetical protein
VTRKAGVIAMFAFMSGCTTATIGSDLTESELESFFRKNKVEGNYVAALKKRSAGVVAYLATVHGYPNNLSVCNELIVPYNNDESKSVLPGEYYCEELR